MSRPPKPRKAVESFLHVSAMKPTLTGAIQTCVLGNFDHWEPYCCSAPPSGSEWWILVNVLWDRLREIECYTEHKFILMGMTYDSFIEVLRHLPSGVVRPGRHEGKREFAFDPLQMGSSNASDLQHLHSLVSPLPVGQGRGASLRSLYPFFFDPEFQKKARNQVSSLIAEDALMLEESQFPPWCPFSRRRKSSSISRRASTTPRTTR